MKKFLLICVAIFFTNSAQAADVYTLDPKHTNITWSANHLGFSSPSGKFTNASGTITLDEARPVNSAVAIAIQTGSLQTGLIEFDNHLKGPEFLNTTRYPEATFVSKSITVHDKSAKIVGDFTLLGITNRITLDAKLNKIGLNNYTQRKTVGFSASTTIKRSDFGMNFGIPDISDNIKINIEIEAVLDSNAKKAAAEAEKKSMIDNNLFNDNAWKIAQSTSSVTFIANKDGSTINGSFKKFYGKIAQNQKDLTKNAVSIDIDVSSISVSSADAIEILKGSDWFDFVSYPIANFTSSSITMTPSHEYWAEGTLTIKGHRVPATAKFTTLNYGDSSLTAVGSIDIKRSDFGIGDKDPIKANGIGNNVKIKFSINAHK